MARPILFIDAVYTNYLTMARRTSRKTSSIQRTLNASGIFSFPSLDSIRQTIETEKPSAIIIIPYDNPTGQLYSRETMIMIAKLCVEYDMWLVSDEAYRELYYTDSQTISIW
jgi:aspartate aminotransferase